MCGIAGCYGRQDKQTVNRMLDALTHRGPNERGIYSADKMVWGHTRLAVVDVPNGHQPILNKDESKGVVVNGGIYNFKKIRDRLETRYAFQTHSDSEVILALYDQRGPDGVRELDGMFAFALFDKTRDTFMLARDPIGIKPLYYGYQDDVIFFSSELEAMSLAGVDEIHEFPPGHYYTPTDGFIRYYRLPEVDKRPLGNPSSIGLRIRQTLGRAVTKRLLADPQVPVGALCSGGPASSIVAAIAALEIPQLHTFTVGMRDDQGNESGDLEAARLVAEHIGSNHHEFIFSEDDYCEALQQVIHKLESYDAALVRGAVPYYFACKLASEYVTVLLSGEGAAELFSGHSSMQHYPLAQVNEEGRRCLENLHHAGLQRADRMSMSCNLELRVPFLDKNMIDLAMKIPADMKIKDEKGGTKEKWILRTAFARSGFLPDNIIWQERQHSSQRAWCQSLSERLVEREISDEEYDRLRYDHPGAKLTSKEGALYFKIFRKFYPHDSFLHCIDISNAVDSAYIGGQYASL